MTNDVIVVLKLRRAGAEGEMFAKVGQAALALSLDDGADIQHKLDVDTLQGLHTHRCTVGETRVSRR